MQKAWKSSQEKKYLETWIKRYQSENSVVQETNSVETPTSQIRAVSTNNDDSTRDRNMEKELLVLYLLPIYKLLKEEDKQEILHKCYRVMKERQQQSEDQPNAM